jgi:hypothetical protein
MWLMTVCPTPSDSEITPCTISSTAFNKREISTEYSGSNILQWKDVTLDGCTPATTTAAVFE